ARSVCPTISLCAPNCRSDLMVTFGLATPLPLCDYLCGSRCDSAAVRPARARTDGCRPLPGAGARHRPGRRGTAGVAGVERRSARRRGATSPVRTRAPRGDRMHVKNGLSATKGSPVPPAGEIAQLGIIGVILLLLLFYGGTMWMSVAISRKKENADDYMTAGYHIGLAVCAASMTATWIWASSMYAS